MSPVCQNKHLPIACQQLATHTASRGKEKFPCCSGCGYNLKHQGHTVAFGVPDIKIVAPSAQVNTKEPV